MLGGQKSLNTSTPCAACKLLRRRCAQECPFSPYFSPHEPQKFACVHKIFGASNVSKMLMEVPESQRADAANSLVYEANARITDPVYGCMGVISNLQHQIQSLQSELNALHSELIRYRCQENPNIATASMAMARYPSNIGRHESVCSQASASTNSAVLSPSTTVTTNCDNKERYLFSSIQ
eukprot:Gb_20398 [translate_table: standard]